MRRAFLVRLALASLGMLLLCAIGYIAVGWAIFKYPNSSIKALGLDRYVGLFHRYAHTLGTLFPADSDGDGVSDSVERYLRADPKNPASCPFIAVDFEKRGFVARSLDQRTNTPDVLVIPGERRRVRLRAAMVGDRIPFARGMQLHLIPDGPGLLCLPGGTPAGNSLLVPVSTDGIMEFDFLFPLAATEPDPIADFTAIHVTHPLSRTPAGVLGVMASRRLSPLPCTVESLPPGDPARILVTQDGGDYFEGFSFVRLIWKSNGASNLCFVEVCREGAGQEWFPIAYRRADEGAICEVAYKLTDSDARHYGPLKFRIVPAEP